MNNFSKRVNFVRVCGATLLAAFAATAFGHDDDWNRTDKPLVWVDSKGKTIGRAVGGDSGGHGAVQLRIHGLALIVPVGGQYVCSPKSPCKTLLRVAWGGEFQSLFYSQPDCKNDDPNIYVTNLTPGSDRAVAVLGTTLYIGGTEPGTSVSYLSTFQGGSCFSFTTPFPTSNAWKVVKTVDLSTLPYKIPFYLK